MKEDDYIKTMFDTILSRIDNIENKHCPEHSAVCQRLDSNEKTFSDNETTLTTLVEKVNNLEKKQDRFMIICICITGFGVGYGSGVFPALFKIIFS